MPIEGEAMIVEVPQSVIAYLTDTRVSGAVDALLSKDKPKIPEDLEWSELSSFYRAVAAATQTRSDFAALLHDVWSGTWRQFPGLWEPDEPYAGGQSTNLPEIWSNGYLSRTARWREVTCELCVFLDSAKEGIQIGFELLKSNKSLVRNGDLELAWEADANCFWSASRTLPLDTSIDLRELDAFREEALDVIAEKTSAPR